jgi:hypothetical protein
MYKKHSRAKKINRYIYKYLCKRTKARLSTQIDSESANRSISILLAQFRPDFDWASGAASDPIDDEDIEGFEAGIVNDPLADVKLATTVREFLFSLVS